MLDTLCDLDAQNGASTAVFLAAPTARGGSASPPEGVALQSGLGRSVLELVLAQAQRIEQIGDELNAARTALEERKLIERGKGLLMTHRGLTEDQAYRLMRQTAMDQGRRLVDVAQSVLAIGPLLGETDGAGRARRPTGSTPS